MRLTIDAQVLQTGGARRGIGRYVRSLLRGLVRARPGWVIEAVLNTALPPPEDADLLHQVLVARFTPLLPMSAATRSVNELYFGDWLTSRGGDVVLELSVFDEEALTPQFVPPRPLLAAMAFDLVPVLFHEQYLASPPAHAIYRRRFRQFAQADLHLAISETTRRDVRELMGVADDRVVTIGGAVEEWAAHASAMPADERMRRLAAVHVDGPFLLYVGGPDPRKNMRGTLEAFARLPEWLRTSYRLVIVCELTPRQESALRTEAQVLGIEPSLRLTNYVSDETLRVLYEECRASIFPSFYEGLGLPVLEAFSCGAPVVASDRSSIPEFAGGAAVLVDPASPESIRAGIERVLASPREQGEAERRRVARAHTWEEVAERAASALDGLIAGAVSRASGPRPRPRIAWVSDVAPAESRTAQFSSGVLPTLTAAFDVEAVVPPAAAVSPGCAPGVRVVSPDAVWARALERPYDLFVYQVGTSVEPFMVEILHWHPGLVVLHDWRAVTQRPVLTGCDALAVLDAHAWHQVRERVQAPVYCIGGVGSGGGEPQLSDMARACIGAIQLTIAARHARDGEWTDAAASAVAEARAGDVLTPRLIEEWAQMRCEGARRRSG
jgi:glycosyltransferase involved in cell wall biosynthesis